MRGKTALTADNADFVDDVDYAAVSQSASPSAATTVKGGSDAIPGTSKGKGSMSLSGSMDSYQVVYVKENVSVYPTQHARERISGRLRLIKQDPSLFMTWIPYNLQGGFVKDGAFLLPNGGRRTGSDRNLYTIRAVSLAEMRSIRRHTPTLGWQYIIIVLTSGLAFPPLYFNNGGVREFLATLKAHAILVRLVTKICISASCNILIASAFVFISRSKVNLPQVNAPYCSLSWMVTCGFFKTLAIDLLGVGNLQLNVLCDKY